MTLYLAVVQQIVIYKLQYNVFKCSFYFWHTTFLKLQHCVYFCVCIYSSECVLFFKQHTINGIHAKCFNTLHKTYINQRSKCFSVHKIFSDSHYHYKIFNCFSIFTLLQMAVCAAMLLRFLSLKIREKDLKTYITIHIIYTKNNNKNKAKQKSNLTHRHTYTYTCTFMERKRKNKWLCSEKICVKAIKPNYSQMKKIE